MKRTLPCLIVALLLAGSAHADESGDSPESWRLHGYWRLQAGWSYPDDSDLPSSALGSSSLDDTGTVGSALGLHILPNFRLDLLEFSWRRYDIDVGSFNGHVDAFTFLTNAYYVPLPDSRVSPFVGAGLGLIRTRAEKPLATEHDTDFAWNARAGVEFKIGERVSLLSEYRFLMDHGAIDDELPIHEVLVGVAVKFY